MKTKFIVSINDLNHYFGEKKVRSQILFDINFNIKFGEIVIMTGPSGSGKTTLLTLNWWLSRQQNFRYCRLHNSDGR
jgi:putative ABC transport system ATP-binding protein